MLAKEILVAAQSTGLALAKPPQPAAPMGKPQNFTIVNTNQSGSVYSSVDKLRGAVSYVHQYSTDAELKEENWQSVNCTQRKCTISGLTPATVYHFRTVAIGRKEQLMYSDVISWVAA